MMTNIRNIALFAHVDAGKTSITEQLLFHSGKIRALGSVDKGNTQTDTLEIEKQRGITVNSCIVSFEWNGCKINLIDTPGHIDFSSEAQKAFLAIDTAIIIISAVEGIQAQTENLINLLRHNKKPFIIFINKIDRIGSDVNKIIEELTNEMQIDTFQIQEINNEANNLVSVTTIWNKESYRKKISLIEKIVEHDDTLLDLFFEKDIDFNVLNKELSKLIKQQVITPVFVGSAKFDLGIENLLNGIIDYLPKPKVEDNDICGVIFKTFHQKDGKWAALRLFNGTVNSRMSIYNASQNINEKINTIKSIELNNNKIIDNFNAGDIALVKGLSYSKPGDFIGKKINNKENRYISKPLLSVQVIPVNSADVNKLVDALAILYNEDPDLDFVLIKDVREFNIKIHGEIQREILQTILRSRFNLEVNFTQPTVVYKETPTIVCEGYVRYWMPKPCWAIMKFKIEPLETGEGIEYSSIVPVNDVKKQYQNDVKKAIPRALTQGILGWQVDDVRITLIEGEDHVMHTKSNDFSIATPMGIMDGLTNAKMTLLEPILSFKIKALEKHIGIINSELVNLRAQIDSSEVINGKVIISGEIPLATSLNFPMKLSSITSGKAKLNTCFIKYQKCEANLGKTREFKGISPLDTAKYILKARKALV